MISNETAAPFEWYVWLCGFADEAGSIPKDKFSTIARGISDHTRIARTPADGPEPVAVKALEWSNPSSGGYPVIAVSAVGKYAIWAGKDLWLNNEQLFIDGTEHYASLDNAKVAAQWDYEQRIRSAITHPVPAPGPADAVSEAEVEAAARAIAAGHYGFRLSLPEDDPQVIACVDAHWPGYTPDARRAIEAAQRARK